MDSGGKGKRLLKKADKLELQGLECHKINLARVSDLDEHLNDAYVTGRPKPIDYHHRRDLVRIFNVIAKELYGSSDDCPVVEGFGSFLMDMFHKGSDLDLSVNFRNREVEFPREKKIKALRKFAKKFYSLRSQGHVAGIQVITSARVPIVKVIDQGTRVECDLSIENRDGILKSEIIRSISAIDERFQKLSCLMKSWGKSLHINSSRDQTLNSISIVSLVAFHLQTRDPAILPPFSALFKDGTHPTAVKKVVRSYLNYGKKNKESVGKLFVTLFIKLASVEKLWQKGLCVSLYEGSWIRKKWPSNCRFINIEDFTDRSQNVARAVGKKGIKKIYNCIHYSLRQLLGFLHCQVEGSKLKKFLFYADIVPQGGSVNGNLGKSTDHQELRPRPAKKMRLTDEERAEVARVWEETQNAKICGGMQMGKGWGGMQLVSVGSEGQKQHTQGWGGTTSWGSTRLSEVPVPVGAWHRESRGGTQPVKVWGGTQLAKGWGLEQDGSGGMQLAQGWGGTTQLGESWGSTRLSEVPAGAWHNAGWGRTQPVKVWGGLQLAEQDGWGRKQQQDVWGVKQRVMTR